MNLELTHERQEAGELLDGRIVGLPRKNMTETNKKTLFDFIVIIYSLFGYVVAYQDNLPVITLLIIVVLLGEIYIRGDNQIFRIRF